MTDERLALHAWDVCVAAAVHWSAVPNQHAALSGYETFRRGSAGCDLRRGNVVDEVFRQHWTGDQVALFATEAEPRLVPLHQRPSVRPGDEFERSTVRVNIVERDPRRGIPGVDVGRIQIVVLMPVAIRADPAREIEVKPHFFADQPVHKIDQWRIESDVTQLRDMHVGDGAAPPAGRWMPRPDRVVVVQQDRGNEGELDDILVGAPESLVQIQGRSAIVEEVRRDGRSVGRYRMPDSGRYGFEARASLRLPSMCFTIAIRTVQADLRAALSFTLPMTWPLRSLRVSVT